MRDGRLLALDTPSELKDKVLPGLAWDILLRAPSMVGPNDGYQLLHALDALRRHPALLRAGLVSDHLRAITPPDVGDQILRNCLLEAGVEWVEVRIVNPSLEDVFLALASYD